MSGFHSTELIFCALSCTATTVDTDLRQQQYGGNKTSLFSLHTDGPLKDLLHLPIAPCRRLRGVNDLPQKTPESSFYLIFISFYECQLGPGRLELTWRELANHSTRRQSWPIEALRRQRFPSSTPYTSRFDKCLGKKMEGTLSQKRVGIHSARALCVSQERLCVLQWV